MHYGAKAKVLESMCPRRHGKWQSKTLELEGRFFKVSFNTLSLVAKGWMSFSQGRSPKGNDPFTTIYALALFGGVRKLWQEACDKRKLRNGIRNFASHL